MDRHPTLANLSMRQLRAFVAIARLQSVTRAAEQLHITQSGLSGMLRDIESQLDCRLFERTTRSVSLTGHGRAFLPVATRVLADIDDAARSLGRLTAQGRGRLSIGASPVVASSILPHARQAFAGLHPGVHVQMHDIEPWAMQSGVRDGELDAGYGIFLDTVSAIRRTPLLTVALVLVEHRDAPERRSVRWRDVPAAGPLLSLPQNNPVRTLVDAHLPAAAAGGVTQVFNHLHTLLAMVEAGLGCTVLPSFVAAAAQRYAVRLSPIGRPKVALEFSEVTRAGALRSPLLIDFGRCLHDVIRQHDVATAAARTP